MKENKKCNIGKKIRLLRERAKMTQIELARLVGMRSTGAISQIESGNRGIKLQAAINVARVFGVHPFVLLSCDDIDEDGLSIMVKLAELFKNRSTCDEDDSRIAKIKKLLKIKLDRSDD